jgi:hypothetical protein
MSPSEFSEEMLRVVRREFYAAADSKRFFEERQLLMQAVTYPAKYLNDRGARVPASKYRAILATVISTIKAKGNLAAIERFSVYFLHCVQQHMAHHGDGYYYAAKELRPVGPIVGTVLDRARKAASGAGQGDQTVPVLAEAHRVLSSRRRIQRAKKTGEELPLFGRCNPVAKRPH